MIKINLIAYRAQRKKQFLQEQIIIGAAPMVLVLIIVGLFWWSITSEISDVNNEVARINKEIEKQKVTMKQIDDYKKKKKTITKKMDIIEKLKGGKTGPVHVLDEIAVNIPGRLWLIQVDQKGMNLDIAGKALDNISISNYMINLEKSLYFESVDLKQIKTSKKRSSKGVQLKEFIVTCKIIYDTKNNKENKKNKQT